LAFIGWSPKDEKEIFTPSEFVNLFEINQIHISGGKFNEEKLDWINREHLKLLPSKEQEEYIIKFIPEDIKNLPKYNTEIINKITPLIMERISKGTDIIAMASSGELSYFFTKPEYSRDLLFFKSTKIPEDNKYEILSSYIKKAISILETIDINNFTKENIKEKLWDYATEVGKGDILWPIRFALSGLDKSPDPFTLAEILGKKETIERLEKSLQILSKM